MVRPLSTVPVRTNKICQNGVRSVFQPLVLRINLFRRLLLLVFRNELISPRRLIPRCRTFLRTCLRLNSAFVFLSELMVVEACGHLLINVTGDRIKLSLADSGRFWAQINPRGKLLIGLESNLTVVAATVRTPPDQFVLRSAISPRTEPDFVC